MTRTHFAYICLALSLLWASDTFTLYSATIYGVCTIVNKNRKQPCAHGAYQLVRDAAMSQIIAQMTISLEVMINDLKERAMIL